MPTWDLPEWRPAVLSRELLKRLANIVTQLKVVAGATDELQTKSMHCIKGLKQSNPMQRLRLKTW